MTITSMSSLTRISDLASRPYEVATIPRKEWASGDYVVGEITGPPHCAHNVELASGRMVNNFPGDHVVGAFGNRAATLEAVGSFADITDGQMHAMTSAGLFGRITSVSATISPLSELRYVGHVVRDGNKVCMTDFAIAGDGEFNTPTILLVGTSMSSGKTTTGRLVVHELEKAGMNVIGVKLTGAGRFRDVLSYRDAGATHVFDFVDAGLPTTVIPEDDFRKSVRPLLHHIDSLNPDILVAEAGASPLEPYNGAAAIDELSSNIVCTILCASDPYAVIGVREAFNLQPDLVTGPATSTTAAIDLVRNLASVEAINVLESGASSKLGNFLQRSLTRGNQ